MWGRYPHHPSIPPPYWWPRRDHVDATWLKQHATSDQRDAKNLLFEQQQQQTFHHRQPKQAPVPERPGLHLCLFPRKLIPRCRSWLTTTPAWLRHPPSSLTDDCLLASTWDHAGTTRHPTPRQRTPTTSFKHLWRQTSLYGSRNKSQAPKSRHTKTRLPDNLDRTPQTLYASKCFIIIPVSIYPKHASTPTP
jgi:hypothetical protein